MPINITFHSHIVQKDNRIYHFSDLELVSFFLQDFIQAGEAFRFTFCSASCTTTASNHFLGYIYYRRYPESL